MSKIGLRRYKKYLEPNCDPKHREIPPRSRYRNNSKRFCTSANVLLQDHITSSPHEVAKSDSEDAVEYISVPTELKNQGEEDISMTEVSEEENIPTEVKNQGEEDISVTEVSDEEEESIPTERENQGEEDISVTEVSDEESIPTELENQEEYIAMNESLDEESVTDDIQQDENLHEKHNINISISKIDILTLILAFSLRYQVSDTGISSLIEMINIIMGKEFVSPSLYRLWNVFNCNSEKTVTTHFFCEKCHTYLGCKKNKSVICDTCGIFVQTSNVQKPSCFLSISLEAQIKNLIRSGILNMPYIEDFNKKINSHKYSDINDGKMYKELQSNTKSLFLTYNFSVDGLAVFNNAKGSLWPILVTINEIPPNMRFKNVLLTGLWFGKKEPKMDIYLKPFVEEAIKLAEIGISLLPDLKHTLKAFAACCCADSVARPCIQNFTQFNGYYGCSWCKHPGFYVNGTIKYIHKATFMYEDRTERETIKLMHRAMTVGKSVQGVKGPSALLPIPSFNLVLGFVPDYMHGIFLGVTKYIVTSWFDSHNSLQGYYIGSASILGVINDRMSKIVFPRDVGRVPRAIYERALYKAIEWKNFLLYMCLPCLKGVLKQPYLDHISLLVGAVDLLMRKNITVDNLKIADKLIIKFVSEVQILYGEDFMTFNTHLLLHFTSSVANWGPLWSHSMFVYEGYNATIQSFIMGNSGIKTQTAKRFLLHQELSNNINSYSTEVSNFISKINSKAKLHQLFIRIGNCNLYGAPHIQVTNISCIHFPTDFLLQNGLKNNDICYFKRMTVNNILFTIESNKQFRTCDSFIYTKSIVGKIIFIALRRSIAEVLVCISKYEITMKPCKNVDNMYVVKDSGTFLIVNVNEIIGKCTQYDNAGSITISKVPVSYELCT